MIIKDITDNVINLRSVDTLLIDPPKQTQTHN